MNTSPTTPKQLKRFYSCLLCCLAGFIIIGFTVLTYLAYTKLELAYAIPICGVALIIFTVFFGWLRRTTYLKYRNNTLIVKGAFNKTLISPLPSTDIEQMVRFSKFVVLRVTFVLDGIQHSYFTFTDLAKFQMMKKRQAVSRVL